MPLPVSPPQNSRSQTKNGAAEQSEERVYETIDKYNGHARVARAVRSSPKPALHLEKARNTPSGARLLLISGRRPIIGTFAPITRTANQPFEIRVIGKPLQHPEQVVAIVRGETEFASVRHDHRQGVEGFARYNTAFLMAPLWPRVGKQDEYTIDRRRRQRRDQQPRIIGEDPNVVELTALDLRKQPGDSRLEYLASDEADLWVTLRLKAEMLPPAETDLEPDRPPGITESGTRFQLSCRRNGQQELRQQFAN
jgi:hypothetical protein